MSRANDADVVKVGAKLSDRDSATAQPVDGNGDIRLGRQHAGLKAADLRFGTQTEPGREISLGPALGFSPVRQRHKRIGSHHLNHESNYLVHTAGNDDASTRPHNVNVTEEPESDWYLKAWAERLGKRQADLVTELGWLKNHAHRRWHGIQPYRRDFVNEVAAWLGIEPFELLMPPERAIQLRQLAQSALAIAAESGKAFAPLEPQYSVKPAKPASTQRDKASRRVASKDSRTPGDMT